MQLNVIAPTQPLVMEYELDAPPEKVWRAVTIPALRERWLPDCDLAGAEPDRRSPARKCAIACATPGRRFAKSRVTFHIAPERCRRHPVSHHSGSLRRQPDAAARRQQQRPQPDARGLIPDFILR